MSATITAVGYTDERLCEEAKALARELNLIVDNHVLPRLCLTPDKLVLELKNFLPLFVDFNNILWQKRREAGKKQGLVRACKPAKGMQILDVTAGWGRDAAILASFGARVLMLERQPVMAALLADGLRRMAQPSSLDLSLMTMDAKQYLQALNAKDYPDVIYMDPMHPERQKSALVKKDMQALQHVIGPDMDAAALLALALKHASGRVVVKWPQRLSPLLPPDFSIGGKTVRFDVYVTK